MSKKFMLLAMLTTGMAFSLGLGGCGGGTWEWVAIGAGAIVLIGSGALAAVLGTST